MHGHRQAIVAYTPNAYLPPWTGLIAPKKFGIALQISAQYGKFGQIVGAIAFCAGPKICHLNRATVWTEWFFFFSLFLVSQRFACLVFFPSEERSDSICIFVENVDWQMILLPVGAFEAEPFFFTKSVLLCPEHVYLIFPSLPPL